MREYNQVSFYLVFWPVPLLCPFSWLCLTNHPVEKRNQTKHVAVRVTAEVRTAVSHANLTSLLFGVSVYEYVYVCIYIYLPQREWGCTETVFVRYSQIFVHVLWNASCSQKWKPFTIYLNGIAWKSVPDPVLWSRWLCWPWARYCVALMSFNVPDASLSVFTVKVQVSSHLVFCGSIGNVFIRHVMSPENQKAQMSTFHFGQSVVPSQAEASHKWTCKG